MPDLNVPLIVAAFKPPADPLGWSVWLENLVTSVVKTCNNHHVRAAAPISEAYPPLQRQLINYATYTDWIDLDSQAREDICGHICETLASTATLEVHDMMLQ